VVQRPLLLTIRHGTSRRARSLPQAKEKAINDHGTLNHIAADLERTPQKPVQWQRLFRSSQGFAGVHEQG